jgi:sugar phosphate isomerase/epimerase
MSRHKIGLRAESTGLPIRQAIEFAQRTGAAGIQVDAVGDLSPRVLSQTGQRSFRQMLRAHGLELAALGCPLRHGLDVREGQEERIDYVRAVMSQSSALGARLVVAQPGRVPAEEETSGAMTEALLAIGHHGDRVGCVLAWETGPDSGEALAKYLAKFDTGGLAAALDPANWLMNGFDPYENAAALAGRVAYSHAKDARDVGANRAAQEVALGHGDIDWLRWLDVLREIDYGGWITIVRDSGTDRVRDMTDGVAFLRRVGA